MFMRFHACACLSFAGVTPLVAFGELLQGSCATVGESLLGTTYLRFPPTDIFAYYLHADKKVTPCAFVPWVDRVGGQPPDGRRPVVRQPTDGRRTVVRPDVRAARSSSAALKKKSFDRGGPVWPPRSNVTNNRLRGGSRGALPPQPKTGGSGGQRPQPKPNNFEKN